MHNYFPIWKLHLFWKYSPILGAMGKFLTHAKIHSCSSDANGHGCVGTERQQRMQVGRIWTPNLDLYRFTTFQLERSMCWPDITYSSFITMSKIWYLPGASKREFTIFYCSKKRYIRWKQILSVYGSLFCVSLGQASNQVANPKMPRLNVSANCADWHWQSLSTSEFVQPAGWEQTLLWHFFVVESASPSINSSLGGDWGTLIILRASTWIIMAGRSCLRVATAIPCAPTYRRRTNYVQQHPGSARSKTVKQPSMRKHHLSDFSTCEATLWNYDANFTTSRVTPRYFCWILQVWVLPCIGRKHGETSRNELLFSHCKKLCFRGLIVSFIHTTSLQASGRMLGDFEVSVEEN